MLVLSRKHGEGFDLLEVGTGKRIATIKVLGIIGNVVKVGIDAERWLVDVVRDDSADARRKYELKHTVNAS